MEKIKNIADTICKWFITAGVKHFKGAVIDIRVGDDLYIVKRYWPKHDKKEFEAQTAELKTIRQKRITKVNQPEFWAANTEKVNAPGYADFMVLDCFEKKLP